MSSFNDFHFDLKRVLFSQLKVGETYYECCTDCRDKFIKYDGYSAIFANHIFFAYKRCQFYELVPFTYFVKRNLENKIKNEKDIENQTKNEIEMENLSLSITDTYIHSNDKIFFQ